MSRSFGVLKWEKGECCPKSLDKLANGNCHSLYRQLPFALPAIAVRPTGNCHSVTLKGARDDFTQGRMESDRLKCLKNDKCLSLVSGDIQPIGGADGK